MLSLFQSQNSAALWAEAAGDPRRRGWAGATGGLSQDRSRTHPFHQPLLQSVVCEIQVVGRDFNLSWLGPLSNRQDTSIFLSWCFTWGLSPKLCSIVVFECCEIKAVFSHFFMSELHLMVEIIINSGETILNKLGGNWLAFQKSVCLNEKDNSDPDTEGNFCARHLLHHFLPYHLPSAVAVDFNKILGEHSRIEPNTSEVSNRQSCW